MKNIFLIMLFLGFVLNSQAQKGKVEYSPKMYEKLKAEFYSPAVQKTLPSKPKMAEQQRVMEKEMLKFMALSPKSKYQKITEMGQCLLNQKKINRSEMDAVVSLFGALKDKDLAAAKVASSTISGMTTKSQVMLAILDVLNEKNKDDTPQSQNVQDDLDRLLDTFSTAAGGWFGSFFGMAALGATLGKINADIIKAARDFIQDVMGSVWDWLTGGDGFMLGPDGQECTPPYVYF